jgi:hypothetical protein
MTRLVLLTVSAGEQYNATTQQMLQKQQAQQQQQQDGSSKRKGEQHKQQPPFPDCESEHGYSLPPCDTAMLH